MGKKMVVLLECEMDSHGRGQTGVEKIIWKKQSELVSGHDDFRNMIEVMMKENQWDLP